ncbi:DUF4181 domain-containing protein [Sporosarcina sp. Marseille-Q4063]|uniref:DUF4181 domain-containing protein n=1 Tax=Sporosarcina sp. Marseille-Q4063 TaxID=2810514 RepID=UPI001BAEB2F2|nr:DUF4181 domain-containing protein [Sporosarcina sp. Marseille-Q4063]QUW22682.1 DUF4181 domain-containing protein [Sporosarcina sp. Marseille-Q4063]
MIAIITILIAILILDQFINRKLITKLNIEESELDVKYVNKLHKYGERILYWASFIVMIIAINEFPRLRILIFVSMAAVFAFRTIMKSIFTRESKTYLLSAITCVLFILGLVIYRVTDFFNVI